MDRTLPVRIVQDNPIYAGLIANMDNAVGRVLKKLNELGLASNTIVVLTGDNGGVSSGDSYSSSELPYRGGKGRQRTAAVAESPAGYEAMDPARASAAIKKLEAQMYKHAQNLEFEAAARLRDQIHQLREQALR